MQNPLDISVSTKPQYDNQSSLRASKASVAKQGKAAVSLAIHKSKGKYIDCHANASAFARNDEKSIHATTPSKPKRIALSLATASIIASGALDIAAAQCAWSVHWGVDGGNVHGIGYAQKIDCTGTTTNMNEMFQNRDSGVTQPNYYRKTFYYLSGSTAEPSVKATFSNNSFRGRGFQKQNVYQEVNFNGLSAANTAFDFTNTSEHEVKLRINSRSGSNLGSLKITGNVSDGIDIQNTTIGTFNYAQETGKQSNTGSISFGSGSNIGSFSNAGTINTMNVNGGSRIGSFNNTGTIQLMNIGDRNVSNSGFLNNFSTGTINTVNVYNTSITIRGASSTWNSGTTAGEHILGSTSTTINIADNSIQIQAGDDIEVNGVYKFSSLVKNDSGNVGNRLGYRHLADTAGLSLKASPDGQGLIISADIATSYGASAYRALVLSILRRNAMTQNILDTMTTKTFHSDRYYNQEVELRLLQYDLSRLTNRSSKFSKTTRKNQSKVDKVREKMAKLTLEQSKGQNLDKGYNNFEVIDQLDAIFIPYTGRRDWRFFALPYASHSYVDLGASTAMEYAGGAIFGVQRNLRSAGIFGGYLGYEFVNTDTELVGNVDTRVQTHSLQAGLNYFQTFAITSKLWEGFLRANIRGGVDLPQFNMQASSYNLKLSSNSDKVPLVIMYNVGAEVKGGLTFYQFKRNSYVSPEVSLSYDMISAPKSWIEKPLDTVGGASYRPLGAHEYYNAVYWHLPQIGAAVRYYKMWGNTFRTNLKAGIKYNMLNKQKAYIQIGNLKDTSEITLPAVYGNLAFDFIWMIKKNHELSFGYDGLFYASTFAKERNIRGQMAKTADWFNGVTTTLNVKYAYWFGGSDYVTDKDGNAVSRSIAEGKKSKKGKKSSKSKKSKKSKKKVYYIDG